MPRYAALLRGVMPTNCRMADLATSLAALEKKAHAASGFAAFVRPVEEA
jgi:hypothetical protein